MKYSKGNKVIIRKSLGYQNSIQKVLKNSNYILTIKKIVQNTYDTLYIMEETGDTTWNKRYIKSLKPEPIKNRFEILDL